MALFRAARKRLLTFRNRDRLFGARLASFRSKAYGLGRSPVFSPDASSMRLDDLLRDVKAKAGVLAEGSGPVCVKPVEDLLQIFIPDARSFILDANLDLVFLRQTPRRNIDGSVLRRKRQGIFEKVCDHLAEPAVVSVNGAVPVLGEVLCRRAILHVQDDFGAAAAAALPHDFTKSTEKVRHIYRFGRLASKFCVEPRSIGNVGDEAVQTPHVVIDDIDELLPILICLDPGQQAGGVPKRC